MIAVYCGNARFELDDPEIRVGRDPSCELRLETLDIAPHHCTLLPRAAGCFVVAAGGETRVNNLAITAPRALYRGDNLQLGYRTLFVEHLDGKRDPVEQRLLDEIRRGDEAARLVYADWLDENADPRRAELLRVEDAIVMGAPERDRLVRRRRDLSIVIDLEWRIQITRVPVERCSVPQCGRDWSQLDETRDRAVRTCGDCGGRVRFCEILAEARGWGGRVAVDGSVRRDFENEDTFDSRF